MVRGVANPGDAGEVTLKNNIVSGSYYCGVALANGYMYYNVYNTGYYDNYYDKNWEFDEYDPVYETQTPYIAGTDGEHYLRPNSPFINAGYEYIEQTNLIGKTTDINSFPDSNKTDLGFHYPNWDFSNAGDGNSVMMDLNADLIVNFKDFAILATGWPTTYDIYDLNTMADEWLKVVGESNIQIQITGDPNNGYVDIGVTGWMPDTRRIFLLASGQLISEIFRFKDDEPLTMDISEFGEGTQQLKLVSANSSGHLTCSHISNVVFSKPLNYCVLPTTYVKNQSLFFATFNAGAPANITVKAYANGGNLVWSQTYSGNNIFSSIPASITNQYAFDYVSFDNSSGLSLAKKVTDPQPSGNVLALIVLPKWKFIVRDSYTIAQVVGAFIRRGVPYAKLSGKNATYDKVAWYARNKYIKYLYIGSTDGHYLVDPEEPSKWWRTNVDLYDGTVVSIKRSDYSDPNNAPPWCTELFWKDEENLKSFATMGFDSLEFAFFDVCYTGRLKIDAYNQLVKGQYNEIYDIDAPHSDMSFALGMSETSASSFYQGWYDEAWSTFLLQTSYQYWTQREFYYLGNGENLYWALYYTVEDQTDFRPEDPVYNYVLRGQGYWDDIVLDNW